MTDGTTSPAPRPRIPRVLWWIAAAVTAGGILMVLINILTEQSRASFGWYAYQPLSAATYFGTATVLMSPVTWAGMAVAVIGLLALAFLLGRRSATPPPVKEEVSG